MSDTKEKELCFVIMPISDQGDYPTGHFTKVYEQIIKPAVEDAGYEAYRVDENNICDAIINKIFNAIQDCPMAICDLSNRNPNVLYELGLRQAYDKPVVLIQDDKTEKIFDISGISTVFYKSTRQYEDVLEAREKIKNAILSTKEGKEKTLTKVIQVNTATFFPMEVSQDDKTYAMLERIYNEIKQLKDGEKAVYWNSAKSNIAYAYMYSGRIDDLEEELWNTSSKENLDIILDKARDIRREILLDDNVIEVDKKKLTNKVLYIMRKAEMLKNNK